MWSEWKDRGQEWLRGWVYYELSAQAAAVAFFAALSLFPLLLLLMAGVGYFFGFMEGGRDARVEVLAAVSQQLSPDVADSLDRMLGGIEDKATVSGPLAGIGFLFTASLVFVQLDRGFSRLWDVKSRARKRGLWRAARRLVMSRLRSLVMLAGALVLVVVIFLVGLIPRALGRLPSNWMPGLPNLPEAGSVIFGVVFNALAFTLLYRFLSKAEVSFRPCAKAGAVAAILWEAGGWTMSAISFGSNYTAYGVIGSFLVVLLWIYFNAMVLFGGALAVRIGERPLPGDDRGAPRPGLEGL